MIRPCCARNFSISGIFWLFCLLASTQLAGQAPPEFNKAVLLAKEAVTELQNSNPTKADSLIRLSIRTYPTLSVYQYTGALAALGDINGSQQIMNMVRLQAFLWKKPTLFMELPHRGITECPKNYAYFGFTLKEYEQAKAVGVRQLMEFALNEAVKARFGPLHPHEPDYFVQMQQAMVAERLILLGNYTEAYNYIMYAPPGTLYHSAPPARMQALITLLTEAGRYPEAAQMAASLGSFPGFADAGRSWMIYIHAMNGNANAARGLFRQLSQEYIDQNKNANYFLKALIELADNNYAQALNDLQLSVRNRSNMGVQTHYLVEKWKVYKALGDAYAGLGAYQRAQDNYRVALLSYPQYQPALQATRKLEQKAASEKRADQQPPVINILEPQVSASNTLAADSNVIFVRGFASDVSGLQEVLVNGTSLYTRPEGDFWGEVRLAANATELRITATDSAGNTAAQLLAVSTAAQPTKSADAANGNNYVLLVAAQHYTDESIPSLEQPIADALKLRILLQQNYGYQEANMINLFNPSANDLRSQLLELSGRLAPNDNLLIFYAGHGLWQEKEKAGYWLLTDAQKKDPATWMSNKELLGLISKLPARHTLLITDACFSGSVFKTRGLTIKSKDSTDVVNRRLSNRVSRVAITSGNDTEVPDKSVFMKHLIKALATNQEKWLSAQKMFVNHIIEAVIRETGIEPRYGTLELAGHVGGDYVFERK